MIKIENTEVFGWDAAIRGMRNPMNSWEKSDSRWLTDLDEYEDEIAVFGIGENDLKLMQNLSKAGSDHGKFLRMINVTMDVTAPLYWWKEFDTYKVGTVANSCSTMHKIHAKEFTLEDFSLDDFVTYKANICGRDVEESLVELFVEIVGMCEDLRLAYLNTKDKKYWRALIQFLPSSYNQRRTVQLNYQVLKHMYFARKNHKLDEWRDFCKWVEELPYFKEICIEPMEGKA